MDVRDIQWNEMAVLCRCIPLPCLHNFCSIRGCTKSEKKRINRLVSYNLNFTRSISHVEVTVYEDSPKRSSYEILIEYTVL